VATLSVIGSTTRYGLCWLVLLIIPLLMVVQATSATVGAVTRTGLQDTIRTRYGMLWALFALGAVMAVNTITLAADLEGGASALELLTGIPYQWFLLPVAALVVILLVVGDSDRIEQLLQYIPILFLAYIGAAILAKPDWGEVLGSTVIPHFEWSSDYLAGALALLGTTLTSYAYVWQSIEEATDQPPLRHLHLVRANAGLGMAVAGLVFWFIVIATGTTLGSSQQRIETAQDAAMALAPVAGSFASVIFGVGLLGSALLALPVLAGTNAYMLAETFGWRRGIDRSPLQARRFYMSIGLSLTAALLITLVGVSPIQLLFWSSIAGGLATPVTLFLLLMVAQDPAVMGDNPVTGVLRVGGWMTLAVVSLAGVAYIVGQVANAF